MSLIAIVYSTVATLEAAKVIARQVIANKLAACVNIFPEIISTYEWEGKIEENRECALIFKTSPEQSETLIQWIAANHPYSVPALLTGTVLANQPFCDYVNEQVRSS